MSKRLFWSVDGTKCYGIRPGLNKYTYTQYQKDVLDATAYDDLSISEVTSFLTYISWNFPAPVTVSKVGWRNSNPENLTFYVSDDTDASPIPGDTGTWTEVKASTLTTGNFYDEIDMTTPTASRWFRVVASNTMNAPMYAMHLFGEYVSPRVELCDIAGTRITDEAWFEFSTASNSGDYLETKQFKIKNNDTAAHTYTVTIDQTDYNDVPFITDRFKLTSASQASPVITYTTPSVTGGGTFSEDITVTATINSADNPANGWYYPKVTVTEAS